MKQIRCIKSTPEGMQSILFRFIGKFIFIRKKENNNYSKKVIEQLRQRGAIIQEARSWMRINIFKDNTVVKLGDVEIDLEEASPQEIEGLLADFYADLYKKGGFSVEMQDGS